MNYISSGKKIFLMMFVMSLFFNSQVVFAAPVKYFNQGVKLFKKANYKGALKKFKLAEKKGLKSSVLDYNIASSFYKLSKLNESKKYFEKVKKDKRLRYVAEYNLGLIALKQGNKKLAKQKFSLVHKNSKDKKLASLSKKKMRQLTHYSKKWRAYASVTYGNDDNVNFSPLDVSAGRSDSFIKLNTFANYLFSGNRKNGWLAEASFYNVNYSSENYADEDELGVGIKKLHKINKAWKNKYELNYYKVNYGGAAYQSILKLGIVGQKRLSKSGRLYLKYHYEDISSDNSIYNYLAGSRQKARAEYRQYNKASTQKIYYELEVNNRDDLTNFSYSPTRHTIRGTYSKKVSAKWRITGDLAYRESLYPDKPAISRNDSRIKVAGYADYYFTKKTKLRAKASYTDNSSSASRYTYERTILSVGVSHSF